MKQHRFRVQCLKIDTIDQVRRCINVQETTMRMPMATQLKASGFDYFNSSVTYDIQTNGKRTLWSEITDMDSDQCPSIAENSDTRNSTTTGKQNETIDCDIRPNKRPESRRECQWSTCTDCEEWIDQLHRLSSCLFAQRVQS